MIKYSAILTPYRHHLRENAIGRDYIGPKAGFGRSLLSHRATRQRFPDGMLGGLTGFTSNTADIRVEPSKPTW